MSVDQLPPGKARLAKPAAQFVRYNEYIDQQIEATRRSVKMVDVLTALLTILVGTLGFLLVAAAVEHWLLPGGFNVAVRLALFAFLFICLTFYTTRKLWPLVRGSINPAYAAQAIEQDNPSLKNSLLNLLLFRQHRDDVTDAVFETLEEQAATRLHRVPIDSAVDRTHLLRLGYALIAILAVVALYKIFSPKDPFASAERVLMPWARIAAPSRVSIENIAPGHVTLSRGEMLQVAADVRGIGEDDPVVVKFTTADGQAVDRPAAMKPDAAGFRYQGTIPPDGDTLLGVAQDLRYHIEAGDARSLEYKVTVISAPTITVERVDYDYPEYTGFADRSIERLGDIRAIEGTRVTIHARANQSIGEAAIDFQADGRRDLQLTAQGEQARATFPLELRDDHETAKFTSYVLRFTGSDGRPNRDPVKYPIDVVPDYRPEAAILAPKEKTRDVRLDETVAIEIEARDPDFSLAEVRLTGESAGRTIFNERLLTKSQTGRFAGRLMFTPGKHELHAGDVVRYWATARDNRAPQANEATTDSQMFRIIGPDPRRPGQPPRDRIAQREQPEQREEPQQDGEQQNQQEQQGQSQDQQQGQDQSSQGEQGQSGGESSDSSQGGEQGESQESGESSSSEDNSGESGEQGSADQSNENGQGENSQNRQGEQQSGGESSGRGESSSSEQGGESGQAQQRPGGKQKSGQGTQTGDQRQGSQDASQTESQASQENGQSSQNNSENQSGDAPARETGDPSKSSPVSSEGDNDGEAFERIQDFLKEQGQLPKESQQQQSKNEQSNGEQGAQQRQQEQRSGESSQGQTSDGQSAEGESPSGQSDSGANKQREQGKPGDDSQGTEESTSDNGESPSGESPTGDSQRGSEDSQSANEQQGAESAAGESGEKAKEPSGQSNQQHPGGGQKTQSEGESGAGNQAEQGKAPSESPDAKSPDAQDKWQQDPSGENQGEQPQQPDAGRGQRQSDSHGEQGGEQTGAAEENNSQKSERDGTGSSGQNQSADEGMGESSEQGAGRNSSSGGQDAQANERTGQSSENMQGEGSQQREGQGSQSGGEQGKQQGEQQGESPSGEQGKQQQSEQGQDGQQGQPGNQQQPSPSGGEQGENSGNDGGNDTDRAGENKPSNKQQGSQQSGTSATDGAGRVPEGVMQPSGATGEAPGADAANLDYARKQTDLVLETLAEQMKRQKVDKRLLDKLGWTEADMKRFVERWQQLKAAADANNPDANEAQRELDDALRSLGLHRGALQQSTVTDDQNRNLRQGYRGAVPLEYQERLRAYNQGVSRARQDDD